jgi:hypothetical protein
MERKVQSKESGLHLFPFILPCKSHQRKKGSLMIFYFAKVVVSVNYEHNCPMSTVSHYVAVRKSGQGQPNLEGMNTILSILKEHPGLPNTVLCPLLHQRYLLRMMVILHPFCQENCSLFFPLAPLYTFSLAPSYNRVIGQIRHVVLGNDNQCFHWEETTT